MSSSVTRLVLVGGGPRAIGVLERLAASAAPTDRLHLDVVDPHLPGAGRIWRAEENPLLLMNSRAADVSIFPDETVTCEGPVRPGPSLAQWADGIRRGTIAAPTAATTRLAEIEALGEEDFPSRRVQALYLEWFFGQVLAALPAGVTVTVHRTAATAVRRATCGRAWVVELEDRAPLTADLLLLAAGHTDARPSATRHELTAFARRHGGTYLPPAQASDAPLDQLAPGQDVIVRGMGLAFIDLMSLLSEGRGGVFAPDPRPGEPGRLRYLPSGREPRLWVGSRRGVPHHSKVRGEGEPTGIGELEHVTPEALRALAESGTDLRTGVATLIAAEIHRWVPGAPAPTEGEADPLAWLEHPLAWLEGEAHPRVTRDAVVRHIEQDLRARTRGDVTAARTLFQLLLRLHGVLGEHLPVLPEAALPQWWHALFSFVDSGPPPHRLHQLLALERAGVVRFLGPRLQVRADESTGRFTARGAAGTAVEADALVDAFLPEPTLTESANPLLRDLVAGGKGRESATSPGTLEVDARHRVITPDGAVQPRLWAVGRWTSELPIGAFARPRTDAPCHRRNDALARELLEAARALPRAPRPLRLGVLGPGRIGAALARTALRRGVEVAVAGRAPRSVLTAALPGAHLVATRDLAMTSDVIALTVPLHVALALDPAPFEGTVVIDATNAWGPADDAALATARATLGDPEARLTTSELLAAHLPGARVVKTLNHIGYHDLEESPDPSAPRALALAADDPEAAEVAARLLRRLGLDPVHLGPLAVGRAVEPGGALFRGWTTAAELGERLTALREDFARAR